MNATADELAEELGEQAQADDLVEDAEAGAEADAEPVAPFYNVASRADGKVRAQAGYHGGGEIVQLAVDVTVGFGLAEEAHDLAYGWYVDEVAAIQRNAMAAAEDEEGDEE